MYGARNYFAYLGYGAIRLFQEEIIRGHVNFGCWKKKFTGPVFTGPTINIARSLSKRNLLVWNEIHTNILLGWRRHPCLSQEVG